MTKLPCPPELWPAFSALLDEALDMPEGDRMTWLASLGTEHAAVRPWVAKVITGPTRTTDASFMRGPVLDESAGAEFSPGQLIGPYLLQQRLGSGGMGEVWLATRSDGTLNRRVALKLPHIHLLAGTLRRRFERERDILAGLSHPHIAQLYDAGVADSQHPYLAMEWVDGIAINDHCRREQLALERRLDLFGQVLEAVGYAHGRLIAHRDLKPSNILVTRDGNVKLLDFGIAKLLANDTDSGATQLTRMGSCIATPAYAAPEQLVGEPVTASVDLYALGVILHELLTGQRPFRDQPSDRAERADVPRASGRIEAGYAATVGGLDSKQLRRALAGDLDAIVAKALEIDPARRYRSAEAFAQDLNRSRQHRPISARHLRATTLAWKFVRRHRLGVAMSCGLTIALIGGSAGIAWQAVRAEREAERATVIKDFLVGVFRASDPRIAENKPRGEITARELLDISSRQIENGFYGQPGTKLELLGVTADIYRELDDTKRSTDLYARETELARAYFGTHDPHTIDGLLGQAYNSDIDGDDQRVLEILSRTDPLIRQAHLDNSAIRARWLMLRGESLMDDAGTAGEAEVSLRTAASLFERLAPRDPNYWDTLQDLGSLALDRSRFTAAAQYYRHAIAVAESDAHLQGDLLQSNQGLALALKFSGDVDGATAAFERGAAIAESTYGQDSRHYRVIASDWAQFRYELGERMPALNSFEVLVRNQPKDRDAFRNGTDAYEGAAVLKKYGHCLAIDGQGERALELLEQARELFKKSAPRATDSALLQIDFGRAYESSHRVSEARDAYLKAVQILESQRAPQSQLADAHALWARLLLSQGELERAQSEFELVLRLAAGHITQSTASAWAGLAHIAVSRGEVPAALSGSATAMSQLDHLEDKVDVRLEPLVWASRAEALFRAGDASAAGALARRARDAALHYYAPGSTAVQQAEALLLAETSVIVRR